MQPGYFSLSLNVSDLSRSRAFYEQLGFAVSGGDAAQGWLVLRQGAAVIGLFQGMLEKNTLTFNPGWGRDATPLDDFDDVRDIQAHLRAQGIEPVVSTDPDGNGPAHIVIVDPDGNPVLIDQHVPRGAGH